MTDMDSLKSELKNKSMKELLSENRDDVQLLGHTLMVQKIEKIKFKLSKIKDKILWWKNG